MSDDESLLPHSLSHEEDDDVEVAPATAAAAKKALSAWHEGLEAKIAAAGKSMHALITEIIVPNPNVRIFSGKETPMSVVRTTGSTRAAAKKNPDLFTGNVFDMLVAGRIGDTNAYRYGYVKGGPPDVVANFTPIAEGQLGHFHDPNVDFKKFAMDTSHDQATLVKLRAPNGTEFSFPRYDECYVISSVRKSEKPRGSSKAPRKTKKDAVVSTPLSELVAQSRVYLTRLQAAPSLTGVPVIFERGPHFDALRKALGTERFPAMRSETVDGPRSVPPTFGLNVAKALELHMNLVLVNLPPSPDDGGGEAASEFRHVYGQQLTKLDRAKSGATWDTETLVHAILVSRMIPQFYTTPAVRVLAERGHALSEKSIGTFFSDFVQSDRSASHCASTILQYAMACQVMAELVLVQHPLLKLAVALIAFASQIYKLGSIGTARFDAGDVDAPVLTCALTGTAIVPGEAFYVIHARSRPTEALPVGQEMIAVVATRCFTAEVPLFVRKAADEQPPPQPMDTTSAPAARAALAPVADGTTPALTEAELKKKAVREKSNQRRKEKRDRDRAAAAALAAAADDAPPPPKKTSQKRKSPEEGTIPAPKPTAAPKKARVEPSTSVTSQTSFTPSLGVASVLTEAGVVLNVTATMNALATFSNVDDVVGANMDYCTKVITSEKGAFQAWMKTNTIIFYYLAEAIIDGTRFIASLTPDEEAAVASGKSTDVDDDVALIDDPEQLEFLRDFMDVEAKTSTSPAVRVTEYTLPTSAFYRELIVTVTSKGKTTPSKFLTALQKHGAVTRDTLLLATKETSPATTTDVELAKRLGMRLAAIKYVFGQAK